MCGWWQLQAGYFEVRNVKSFWPLPRLPPQWLCTRKGPGLTRDPSCPFICTCGDRWPVVPAGQATHAPWNHVCPPVPQLPGHSSTSITVVGSVLATVGHGSTPTPLLLCHRGPAACHAHVGQGSGSGADHETCSRQGPRLQPLPALVPGLRLAGLSLTGPLLCTPTALELSLWLDPCLREPVPTPRPSPHHGLDPRDSLVLLSGVGSKESRPNMELFVLNRGSRSHGGAQGAGLSLAEHLP